MSDHTNDYDEWIGNTETVSDYINESKTAALAATFDESSSPADGNELPHLWHWGFLNPTVSMSEIGHDGHPKKGGFLPPIDYPRRMWAGSKLFFEKQLQVGEKIQRKSTIQNITFKSGNSGKLAFVNVEHEITGDRGGQLVDQQTIVYRDAPAATKKSNVKSASSVIVPTDLEDADWEKTIIPNSVMLFRYSAVTFNSHRIHYDRDYCINEEQYPGLVLHGPLTATLLMNFVREIRPDIKIKTFEFRGLIPLFDMHPFSLQASLDGDSIKLWVVNHAGLKAMEATAGF